MPQINVKDAAGGTVAVEVPNGNGQATMANSRPVVLASDQTPVLVAGLSERVQAAFTRPADTTAYAIGDAIANSTVGGSVTPMSFAVARTNGGTGAILRARLTGSKTSGWTGNEIFRLHLFLLSPGSLAGDNAAFAAAGVAAGYIGYMDIVMTQFFTDGAVGHGAPAVGSTMLFKAAAGSQNIFGLLEARSAFTPGNAETYTVQLEVQRD